MSCLSCGGFIHIDQAHPSPGEPYPLPTLPSSSLYCTSIIQYSTHIYSFPSVSTLSIPLFSTLVLIHSTSFLHSSFVLHLYFFYYFFPCFYTFPSSLNITPPSCLFPPFLHSLSFLFFLSLFLMGFLLNFCSVFISIPFHSYKTSCCHLLNYFTMWISHFNFLSLSRSQFSSQPISLFFDKRDSCMKWFSRFSIIFSK